MKAQLRVIRMMRYIRGFFPKALPTGATSFNDYCGELFETYGIPDLPSYRHAVASMVMHLGPQTHKIAPYYFAKSIKKAQANQVAYSEIQRLKAAEEEAQKAAQESKQANPGEATPTNEKVADASHVEVVSGGNIQAS